MEFWISVGDERYGPYGPDQVQAMVAGGQLAPDAQIWFPDRGQWILAQHLTGFVAPPQPVASGASTTSAAAGATSAPGRSVAQPTPDQHPVAGSGGNVWGIGALVLGVAALAVSWMSLLHLAGLGLAILGVVVAVLAFLRARRGGGRSGLAIVGLVLCIAAIAVALAVEFGFLKIGDSAQESSDQAQQAARDAALHVTLGKPQFDGFSSTVTATVTNTGSTPVSGGMFTVQAVAHNGTVVDQSVGAIPALQAGQSTRVKVVFQKKIPPGATVSVTDVNSYES